MPPCQGLKQIKKRLKNWFLFRLITILISLLNFLPRSFAISVGGFLGRLAYLLIADARKRTQRNLRLAFGKELDETKLRRLASQVFENVGKNVADAVRLKKMRWEDIERITEIEGLGYFDRAYRTGKGVIGFTGHISNFELMAAYFSLRGYKLSVVGRELYDPRLDRLLVENRESVGLENIPSSAGIKPILKVLRAGKFLGVLADQDSSRVRGVFVDFFGRPARTPAAPALFAYKTGSPIVPMAIVRKDKNKYKIIVKPPVELTFSEDREKDIVDVTQKCTRVLESIIREYPDQWLWMHDRWESKPD
ncbi:MAG: lysophospholipid acyltransferase family protein [candidate division Zixibacteria bacterium]|nr:lysophospholipid acyltransferase family protein [candidate division Zixibacteria bacterium]